MALTEIERELNKLRRLLSEARGWNWIDFEETDPEDREMLPDLVRLDSEITEALEGTVFSR